MRPVKTAVAAALLAGVAALGAGCMGGGDEDSSAGSTTSATMATTSEGVTTTAPATTESDGRPEPPADQSRWAKQADAACRPWQQRIDALTPPADAAELEPWLGDLRPLVRKEVGAVKAVKPPAKQSEARNAALFIESMTKLERGLTRYRAAINAGDTEAIERALAVANAAGAAARSYAVSLDITQCGGYSES